MSNIAAMSRLARYAETTQGDGPADWNASGILVHHIGDTLDMSGVERTQIEDLRNQTRVFANERMVEGLDNPEFPFSVYGHGTGVVTEDATQISADPLVTPGIEFWLHLEHTIGGLRRGWSTVTSGAGSTTTVIDVADASNYVLGDYVAVELGANLPSQYPTGTAFPRRIVAIDTVATPDNITLDQALPAAPPDATPVHGCVVAYTDEDVLCDSDGAGGPFTWSWLVQKGLPGSVAARREAWEFNGAVSTMQSFSLERDGLLTFAFNVMAGSHLDPADPPEWPTWTQDEQGLAPIPVGPLSELWLEDDGTTTNTLVDISQMEVEPGVPRTRTEVVTSEGLRMQGTASYATQPADTTITLSLSPFGIASWTDQAAETEKQLRWSHVGPAGSGFAVGFHRVSHMATPKRNVNDAVAESMVVFKAHEENDNSLATNINLWKSKMVLVGW